MIRSQLTSEHGDHPQGTLKDIPHPLRVSEFPVGVAQIRQSDAKLRVLRPIGGLLDSYVYKNI